MLAEFIKYLTDQIGQPYLWGGQHTRLTPETYEAIIHKREDGRGKYADGTTYAEASIAFCRKKFEQGATVLYAYDCSGLGMYWIADLKHIWKDRTADQMMHGCTELICSEPPEKGWWVFKQDNRGKATHIGYMVDDEYLIEAKGRKFGVVKTKWREKDWSIWGIPSIFEDEIRNPEPKPEPPTPEPDPPTPPEPERYVEVVGGTVRVRAADHALSKKLFTARRGDTFPLISIAPSGWYQIETEYPESYITNKPKYTRLVEK
jgi:hypothetical protein